MIPRVQRLRELQRKLAELPPGRRIEAILESPNPAESVRSLTAQDFFLTVAEAGLDAALPLIPYASRTQVEFLFDIDSWDRDRLDPQRAGQWLAALHKAGADQVARWLREGDEATVVLVLSRLLRVFKLDESTDPDFWPPDRPVPTLDGIYFIEPANGTSDEAAAALWDGLTRMRAVAPREYEGLLEQVLWVVPPEQEEEAFQRRSSRLAEFGFPPFDEAFEVWAAVPEADPVQRARMADSLAGLPRPVLASDKEPSFLPVCLREPQALAVVEAVRGLPLEKRERIGHDLVRLGNRFALAGLGPLGDPETHHRGLRQALLHLNLGLTVLCGEDLHGRGLRALAQLPLADIVRAGTGAVLERAGRAHLIEKGWLSRVYLARPRLDSEIKNVLEGLLLPRPQFHLELAERPFATLEDLAQADRALEAAESFGIFLEEVLRMEAADLPEFDPLPAEREDNLDLEWSTVALTSIARLALGDSSRPVPLSPPETRRALSLLLPGEPPRQVGQLFRELTDSVGLTGAAWLLTRRLEDEAGGLYPDEEPDPRFLRSLLFSGS